MNDPVKVRRLVQDAMDRFHAKVDEDAAIRYGWPIDWMSRRTETYRNIFITPGHMYPILVDELYRIYESVILPVEIEDLLESKYACRG